MTRTQLSFRTFVLLLLFLYRQVEAFHLNRLGSVRIQQQQQQVQQQTHGRIVCRRQGWVQADDGEWEWEEDDPNYVAPTITIEEEEPETTMGEDGSLSAVGATPSLPSGKFRPKQSLGQNFLRDGNTVAKILRAFHKDATRHRSTVDRIVELGPGAGALTDPLVKTYGTNVLQCIEIDERAVEILHDKHPNLRVRHADVLQVDYPAMMMMAQDDDEEVGGGGQPLVVVGNLPYYITSQILFALADASHAGAVDCATVTMQWEVAQRMVAPIKCKDYGILSVVFQLYADVGCHFKIPPTVFYPRPKVDSALVGLHFVGPTVLRQRLAGVDPSHLRRVVTTAFQQRRKTIRNSLGKLVRELSLEENKEALFQTTPPLPIAVQQARDGGDDFAQTQELAPDWASKRPEELTPGQFVEVTRLLFGPAEGTVDDAQPLGKKVWRKLKHGN